MADQDANIFGGKTRLQVFLDRFLPADFECGDISITFNEDGSAYVAIGSPYKKNRMMKMMKIITERRKENGQRFREETEGAAGEHFTGGF